ncbi:hypothetical protein [Herbidospora cretacea]|uniref:hypothetical protein n=1 Tax=Herbidospora cretacea TaxID=28444 RepID=UPI0018CC38C3|nr:hypothetical protein [Herbidospora cretacea]
MQLVGELRLDLDAMVEAYLPGLIRRNATGTTGGDSPSGSCSTPPAGCRTTPARFSPITELRDVYVSPRDLLDLGLAHKPSFAPRTKWE